MTTTATLTAEQETAFAALAEKLVDFAAAGIERFGSADAFMAKLVAYNAQSGR